MLFYISGTKSKNTLRWLFRFFTSHRIKKIHIAEIHMKKQYKLYIIKNKKITNKNVFDGVPLKGYIAA